MRAEQIAELLPWLTEEEKAEAWAIMEADKAIWRPLPGPQSDAYHSEATVLGYGGGGGGGKTDLICGMALTGHRRSMIVRSNGTELTAIEDRLEELLGTRNGYNSQKMIWRLDGKGRQIEFGSLPNATDHKKYAGRPHDFKAFDEAANLRESQVRFLLAWLRTTTPGQRKRALLTFNPPTDAEGRWIIDFFAPWLDDKHPNPAAPGELRWFATIDGVDTEMRNGTPYTHNGELIEPTSRTFIPSRVSDNPYLMGTGYMQQLQALPEPLRSQMLHGDFKAGMKDDAMQVIPTAWVDAAMARWKPKTVKGPMDSIGADIARGGDDNTVIARRHATWYDELISYPGPMTPDGPAAAGQIISARRDRAPVHVDVVGWGASAYDFLKDNDVQTVPINGANKTTEKTRDADLAFANKRAELYWRMREELDPENPEPIALPPDPGLKGDLCAPKWSLKATGILVESKDEIAKRIGRSPDKGDAVVMARINTVKTSTKPKRLKLPDYGAR